MKIVNKFAAKGKEAQGKKKACKKSKCQGCEMCTSLLQADDADQEDLDADDDDFDSAAASLAERSGSDQMQPQDLPLCPSTDIQKALDQMTTKCSQRITAAVQSNTPLGDPERCLCYLQVDKAVADSLQCKSMPAKTHTLTQEYGQCVAGANLKAQEEGTCSLPQVTPYLNHMTKDCQDRIYDAIEDDEPLEFDYRCGCYLQLNEAVAQELNCKSMPQKELTIKGEYDQCKEAKKSEAASANE
jgi:hypothetical protein